MRRPRGDATRSKQGGWIAHKAGSFRRIFGLVISADQTSLYNAFVAAGSPAGPCDVAVTINSGKTLQLGFTMGAWATGTSMRLVNNGSICGAGGAGGQGDSVIDASHVSGAHDGLPGGPAIIMSGPLVIDNTAGFILGGGGGGGAGGMAAHVPAGGWNSGNSAAGTPGGGGRGFNNASAGALATHFAGGTTGSAASDGSSSAPGAGGRGTSYHLVTGGEFSGDGGEGGDWGAAGSSGLSGSGPVADPGGSGGFAGNAITKNGFALDFTFARGNTPTRVKGLIV